jgi:hypothetical protein
MWSGSWLMISVVMCRITVPDSHIFITLHLKFVQVKRLLIPHDMTNTFWHGYVLHAGITYKSWVPRTSQMTSHLLYHTAAAMRTHNVLCNSYNTRPPLCACISCYVTVTTVEINRCSFRRMFCVVVHTYLFENCMAYFHSSKLVYHGTPNTHRRTTHPW